MTDQICPDPNCLDEKELPSALEMAKNLLSDGTKIIGNALKGNDTLVSEQERVDRWSICQGCEYLLKDRCSQCGCFMKVKVAFKTSKCPIDKWGNII